MELNGSSMHLKPPFDLNLTIYEPKIASYGHGHISNGHEQVSCEREQVFY